MRRTSAAAGSALFLALAPGCVAGLVPFWVTGWRVETELAAPLRLLGLAAATAGAAALLVAFWRFVQEGAGTPAPVAPPEHLVVGGLYRHVRNPMYLAVLAAVFGQALLLGSGRLAAYGVAVLAALSAFVRCYEEPALSRRFGAEYETYRRAVPRWWPRWRRG
jgi:protein-S-isoprenylcysteine O-methyltransferase Ste14